MARARGETSMGIALRGAIWLGVLVGGEIPAGGIPAVAAMGGNINDATERGALHIRVS